VLSHRLTYHRTNHRNLHVLNDLDRFHLVSDVIDRVPGLGARAAYAQQAIRETLIEHKPYITRCGEDMPDIRDWTSTPAAAGIRRRGQSAVGSTRKRA
jgi:xylulose-5-phosphate/fructose-6-phosphate phosphoketolase